MAERLITDRGVRPEVVERVAKRLLFEQEHLDPRPDGEWDELSEESRQFYRSCAEGVLAEIAKILDEGTKGDGVLHAVDLTPEMIQAGALALSEYTSFFEGLEDGAERIYRSMEAARLA